MAFGDIRLKLVGGSEILTKLDELDKLAKKMRSVVSDLEYMGLIRIDSNEVGGVGVDAEKE